MVPRFLRRALVAPAGASDWVGLATIVGDATAGPIAAFDEWAFYGELLEQEPGRDWSLGIANSAPPALPGNLVPVALYGGVRNGPRLHYNLEPLEDQGGTAFPIGTSTHLLTVYVALRYPPLSWRQVFQLSGDGGTTAFQGYTDTVPPGAVAVLVQLAVLNLSHPVAGIQYGGITFREYGNAA